MAELTMPGIDPSLRTILNRIRLSIENQNTQCAESSTALNTSTENVCRLCNNAEFVFNPDALTVKPCVCREQKTIDRILASSGLTKYQRQIKLTEFRMSTKTADLYWQVKQYLDEFRLIQKSNAINKGLLIIGGVGIGKTMLLTAIANELLDMCIPIMYVVTPDLIADLRCSQFVDTGIDMERKISALSTVLVCIFDDVAKEKPSEWVQTQYYRILDARYRLKLPTLFSSNYTLDQIAERLGDAVSSRIYALSKERQIYVQSDDYRVYGNS